MGTNAISAELLARLQDLRTLPSLPHVLLELLRVCERQDADIKAVVRLIESDPSLALQVVGLVNSLRYSLPQRVRSPEQAVLLLGVDAVRNVTLCASVGRLFSPSGSSPPVLKRLWRHSLECGLAARSLAAALGYGQPDEAFLAGLVHDVGKLVFLALEPEGYPAMLARAASSPELLLAGETRLGGLHSDVGAWLAERWKLDAEVVEALRYHHEPYHRVLDSSVLVKIVHSANYLTSPASVREQYPHDRVASLLGLGAPEVQQCLSAVAADLEGIARALGLQLPAADGEGDPELQARDEALSGELGTLTLLLGTLWSMLRAQDVRGVLETVFQSLSVHFGAQASLYFGYRADSDLLVCEASSSGDEPAIEGLSLNRKLSRSSVARSMREAKALRCSMRNGSVAIVDRQIGRILGCEEFLSYPLHVRGEPVGALVVGLDGSRAAAAAKRERLLDLLAGETALALYADRVRQREAQRVQMERFAAAQVVAERVVHEVRTPLAIMKNQIGILRAAGAEDLGRTLDEMNGEVDRVARLIASLSQMAPRGRVQIADVDLDALVAEFLPVLRRIPAAERIGLAHRSGTDVPRARANQDYLKQVLINLVRNAAEAMPEGGAALVSTEREEAEGPGGAARATLVVEDTGPGIAEGIRGRLFEPFVTSKGAEHRGLGLSVARALVEQLGGSIRWEAGSEGRGSRFVVTLPSAPAGQEGVRGS